MSATGQPLAEKEIGVGGSGSLMREMAMPIYEYELCEGDCKVCGGKFTFEAAAVRAAPHAMPGLQKAGAQNHLHVQLADKAQAAVHHRCQEGRFQRLQASRQGRIRTAVVGRGLPVESCKLQVRARQTVTFNLQPATF